MFLTCENEKISISQEILENFDFLKSGFHFNKDFTIKDREIFDFFKSQTNVLLFPGDFDEYDFLDFLGYSLLHEYYPRFFIEFMDNEKNLIPLKKITKEEIKTIWSMKNQNYKLNHVILEKKKKKYEKTFYL